jgi:hypothetical protein
MNQLDLAPGVRISNLPGTCAGTVSRVYRGRTFWRHRPMLCSFWIRWDHDPSGGEAQMMPGDEEYLLKLP